jgi:hypothetical protein
MKGYSQSLCRECALQVIVLMSWMSSEELTAAVVSAWPDSDLSPPVSQTALLCLDERSDTGVLMDVFVDYQTTVQTLEGEILQFGVSIWKDQNVLSPSDACCLYNASVFSG